MGSPKIFISYAKEDYNKAERIYNALNNYGAELWMDEKSLKGGQHWKIEIQKNIENSNFFLAILSNNSINKIGYSQNELKQGLEILNKYPNSKAYLIPIRLELCKPTEPKLNDLHYIDMFPNWDEGIKDLLKAMDLPVATKDWPPEKFYGTLAKEEISYSILIELKKNRSGLEDEILANILNLPKQEIQDHLDILNLSYFIQIEKTMGPSYFAYIRPEGLQKLEQIESECLPKSN